MAVVNVRDLKVPWPEGTVYVERNPEIWRRIGSQGAPPWDTPFAMKSEADRGQVISGYTRWLADRVARDPRFHAEIGATSSRSRWQTRTSPATARRAPTVPGRSTSPDPDPPRPRRPAWPADPSKRALAQGTGAVVLSDVPPGATAVGVPARIAARQTQEHAAVH